MAANTTSIYTLEDPDTGVIKYVGKTNKELNKRLAQHLCDSKRYKYKSCNWIQSLIKENKKPKINLLDTVDRDEWEFWEIYWIAQFKTWGFNLKNHEAGGMFNRNRVSSWNKNLKLTEEHKNKIKVIRTGCVPHNKGKTRFDLEVLKDLYIKKYKQHEIAKILGTDQGTISRYLKKHNINKNKTL